MWPQMFYSPCFKCNQVTDTKVLLESCLLQWSDYNVSHDQVLKWLKDMEKRLRETTPKGDLGEKKAELQRIKVRNINDNTFLSMEFLEIETFIRCFPSTNG